MSRNAKINSLLLLLVAALAVIPLVFGLGDHKEEPFAGADGEAETAITELHPDYEPWFSPLYEPPSGEIESALFALQAALGAGVLAYYFGLRRGRRQGEARTRELIAADAGAGAAGTGTGTAGTGTGTEGTGADAASTGAEGTGADAGTGAAGPGAGVRTGPGDGRD
ncbi:cobalt/nickel transport protein [Streptomyces sp. T12]|uniref:energy-coupling factor ABC transporter substrate-binding protein n=1 Tax=Streptomyces sp. T12 TaxID=477697 RepID=UPI0011A78CE5|nr:energy-coupling factor ABC transporter substrate-binding protein [Streptomyces sp. T12]TWD18090.1 cobalt/nickel transport protein [Streptomyces sp. T12]